MIQETQCSPPSMVQRMANIPQCITTNVRENWKEWIYFQLGYEFTNLRFSHISYFWAYGQVGREFYDRDAVEYWILPLVPFVWTFYWLFNRWWNLARFCKKKGWIIRLDEGEA